MIKMTNKELEAINYELEQRLEDIEYYINKRLEEDISDTERGILKSIILIGEGKIKVVRDE